MKLQAPLDVEVIIPAYNAAPFIAETLGSIFAQTRWPQRVTVINDRSTDGTAEVVRRVSERAPAGMSVVVLDNAGPQGPSAARNTALRRSGEAFVTFQDADDLMLPRQLETLHAMLTASPEAVLSFCDTEVFGPAGVLAPSVLRQGGLLALAQPQAGRGLSLESAAAFRGLLCCGLFGTSACMVRRQSALQAGAFDEQMMYAEDTDLFLRLALLGPFVGVDEMLSRKRVHGRNLTHRSNQWKFEFGTVLLIGKILGHLPGRPAGLPPLDDEQRAQAVRQLGAAIEGLRYHASTAGWRAYSAARALCRRLPGVPAAPTWKHGIRSLACSLGWKPVGEVLP